MKKTVAKPKAATKPKLTDEERHKRFVDMAHDVGADEAPEVFEKAFQTVVKQKY